MLAALRNRRIHATAETITKSLVGDYGPSISSRCASSWARIAITNSLMAECDVEIERHLTAIPRPIRTRREAPAPSRAGSPRQRATLRLRRTCTGIFGVDLTTIPGIDVLTAHTLLTEVGTDLSKFPTPDAFASWLGLCPDNRISGGKVLSVKTRRVNNRAALALRMSAQAVQGSRRARRLLSTDAGELGGPKAITATAHKLARVVYHLITTGQPYADQSIFRKHEEHHRDRVQQRLQAQAAALGLRLVPATVVP